MVDLFILEHAPEAFHRGVVIAIPFPAHVRPHLLIKISAARSASRSTLLTSTPGAFNDAKLIHQSGQPATIAASKTKEPEVSHPVVERIPITKSDIDVLPSNGVKANTPLSSALRNIEKNYLVSIRKDRFLKKADADFG
ncbi:MAG TPA: hypothetical protein PLL15_07740, partial [Syntrophales bacterium]|nr:hypothetical protein [Syntrophales bacterium]HOS77922.1 hypothetical protein [Syntrophales bacterium]